MARSRRAHRKGSRKANRRNRSRKQRGGVAPVGEYGAGSGIAPMKLNLAQGQQFAAYHAQQHGGGLNFGPYPGAVQEASVLPADLVASAKLLPLNQSFDYIRQFGPSSDNPNLKGGKRRRRGRKSRKGRKGSRKQRGGGAGLVRWGAGGGRRRNTRRNRRNRRMMYGGSRAELNMPMDVSQEGKMLISPQMQAQAGLNPEWKLAENPTSFDPIETKY